MIDTATSVELVAATSIDKTSDKTRAIDVSHSTSLFDSIDCTLKDLGISINDIDVIGVGIGPGSFTGIRIAVSTARMLAQVLEVPLIGIKTHLIYATSVEASINENILIAFDAKKGRVFGALYRRGENPLHPNEIIPPGDYQMDFLIDNIVNEYMTYLVGDGAEKFYSLINSRINIHRLMSNFIPSGEIACELTKIQYHKSPTQYSDINSVIPLYTRKSDAEIVKHIKNRQ